jgi:DNA-binding MarR family transcriptional regulator
MPYTKLYFDFLRRCEKNRLSINRSCAHISSKQLVLFIEIALKHAQGQPMTVSQTMALRSIASSAALHDRIDDLREAGMIHVSYNGADRRTKYLIPSDKGHRYLTYMGALLCNTSFSP